MKKTNRKERIRQMAAHYPRIIEWSDEDNLFIGSAPPLVGQCCHGETEEKVARQLAVIVEDLVEDVIDGKMPEPILPKGKKYSGRFIVRVDPDLHKRVALQAMARGESLNQFVVEALTRA